MKASKIVLGTVQFGLSYGINNTNGKPSQDSVRQILNYAFDHGITELDTADAYGDASEILHQYFVHSGKRFSLMSKFSSQAEVSFRKSFEMTLERLGVHSLKGYYFHRFADYVSFKDFEEVKRLKQSGVLENFGVSLYTNDELKKVILDPYIDIIQLPMNLLDRDPLKQNLLKSAHRSGKKIYVRSIFLQGLFFRKPTELPQKLSPLQSALEEIQRVAKVNKLSVQDLCFKYILGKPYIDKLIIGVDTLEQLESNFESVSKYSNADHQNLEKEIEQIPISAPHLLHPGSWT